MRPTRRTCNCLARRHHARHQALGRFVDRTALVGWIFGRRDDPIDQVAVLALAVAGAFALALAQRAYAPPSADDTIVSASTRDLYVIDEVDGPFGYARDLPLGESQYLTVKGLVVDSAPDSTGEHTFRITPDGGSITVNRGMQPGESYSIHVSLNNSSAVPQSAELTVDTPQSMTIEVRSSPGSAAAPEVNRVGHNHWTVVHSGAPAEEAQAGGPFDLTISVHSSRYVSQEDGRVQIDLRASEYIPRRPQLAGLVY